MAISELYTNTATISTTEYSLTNNSTSLQALGTDGVIQVFLDLNAMIAGDQYQFRIYEKVTSGGTQRVLYEAIVTGPQSPPLMAFPALVLIEGWEVTGKKLAGTDRSIRWSIRSVA